MDVTHIVDALNDAQREAVCAPAGNVLVLAGAGSGKTRVLVHRIAWLIQVEGVSPYGILAVTFTNKAAGEMRGRIETLLGRPTGQMWVGTFHGIAHRLLRAHWREAGLPETFQILDSEDQNRALRRLIKEMGLDDSQWSAREVQSFINARKDEGLRAQHIDTQGDPYTTRLAQVYEAYQAMCDRAGLVDFAELLLRAHELWLQRPDVLAHYRERFRHILVDEFQDTNAIQYAWLRLLAGATAPGAKTNNVFIVGDDDQSIYGWRGARVENIHQFSRDFPQPLTFRLEQNYRSTGTILSAANALITHNSERLGKNLWTADGEGEPIRLYAAFNDLDEAQFVVGQIRRWSDNGGARRECAVLYRSNAQSRVFEEALISAGIPYRVYGGLRFFERAEIKDALAYLRLMSNPADDAAFERIVNTPTRGIGARTLEQVRDYARTNQVALWQAMNAVIASRELSARATNALQFFASLITRFAQDTRELALHEQVEHVIQHSGLIEHFRKEGGERGRARLENLDELITAAREFAPSDLGDDEPRDALTEFLAHSALEAGEGQAQDWEDSVQLMTLHSAKGLEFPLVFLVGLEEGLFPHRLSIDEPGRLEEERRLCYVGMTRAMQQLVLTYAEVRRLHGEESYARASRFIREIPTELVEEVRLGGDVSRPLGGSRFGLSAPAPEAAFALGQHVVHATFGEGVVLGFEGEGARTIVRINFAQAGTKLLILDQANLQPC
ncbi:MAG: DNA helicase II [Thiotrichales bacterium SG8_50]|nr:MAG: DNA helicase II [Thiotrichales bacterium SG8_50]